MKKEKIEQKTQELEKIKKEIKKLQKKRMALDGYIRLYLWRKENKNTHGKR